MFQAPAILSEARVQTLTIPQLRQVYEQRLAHWMAVAGFTSRDAYYKRSGGTTWSEFRADWLAGKITVKASELPEVDDYLEGEPMDYAAIERAMEDYMLVWLVKHGEMNPSSQRLG
jgi:hypothetical protein